MNRGLGLLSAAGQSRGAYVTRPVFALAAPGGWQAPGMRATGSRSATHHVPNPAFAGYLTMRTGVTSVVAHFKVPGVACTHQETAISPGAFLLTGPNDRPR